VNEIVYTLGLTTELPVYLVGEEGYDFAAYEWPWTKAVSRFIPYTPFNFHRRRTTLLWFQTALNWNTYCFYKRFSTLMRHVHWQNVTFMGPCIVNEFKYNQQDSTLHSGTYYYKCSTYFRRFLRPSSGAQNCIHSIGYMSSFFAATAIAGEELTHDSGTKLNGMTSTEVVLVQLDLSWWWAHSARNM
jgi:hypothetical protein